MNRALFRFLAALNMLLLQAACYAQYAPVSTIAAVSTYSNTATITISTINFNNITGCDMRITYDQSVALAISVTANPVIGGILNSNTSQPGLILINWFTASGVTLPDNTVIFNLGYTKVAPGVCPIIWNDLGTTCTWGSPGYFSLIDIPTANYYINGSVTFLNNDAPHTIAPGFSACSGTMVDLPIRVTQFSNVGMVMLSLQYNPAFLNFQSWTNVSGFPGLTVNAGTPGLITISGTVPVGGPGYSLPDSAALVALQCFYSGGTTDLTWLDGGTACQYAGLPPAYTVLNDLPQNLFYINGILNPLPLPAPAGTINGPAGGDVCAGQEEVLFSVAPISNALTYSWNFPPGFNITGGSGSNSVTVTVSANAVGGGVTVYGINECGNGQSSPVFPVNVTTSPVILSQPVSPGALMAGTGSALFSVVAGGSYLNHQWQEFVTEWKNIPNGGVYSGSLTQSLTISQPPLSMNGYRYRCEVGGMCLPGVVTDGTSALTVTPVIGSEELIPDNIGMWVYPNPVTADSKITIRAPVGSEVFLIFRNLLGEIRFSEKVYITRDEGYTMVFSSCITTPGVYFLTGTVIVKGERYRINKKLIIPE